MDDFILSILANNPGIIGVIAIIITLIVIFLNNDKSKRKNMIYEDFVADIKNNTKETSDDDNYWDDDIEAFIYKTDIYTRFATDLPQEAIKYFAKGQYENDEEKFLKCMNSALEICPTYADVYFKIGEFYRYKSDEEKGNITIENFKKAKELYSLLYVDNKDKYYYERLFDIANELNDNDDIIEYTSKLIELNPSKAEHYYFYRGLSKKNKDDFSGALDDYNKMVELMPTSFSYSVRGDLYFDKEMYKNAISDYDTALEKNDNTIEYHVEIIYSDRAKAKWQLGDFEGALSDYNKLIEMDPVECYYKDRADLYFENKMYDKALSDYNIALENKNEYLSQEDIAEINERIEKCK